jgi:TonB family protein
MKHRTRLSTRILSATCFLLSLAALRLPAQNQSGRLVGSIYDPSGAPVPNATVIMANHKTDTTDMTASGVNGAFTFAALPTGDYEMKVVKQGFEEYKAPRTVLEAGHESSQDITLKVGSVAEEVNVVAESAKTLPGATAAKPTQVRSGGDLQAPKLLSMVKPIYPAAAKENGVEGTVVLHAVIGMEGSPLSLRVMNSRIDPGLARAAVEAVSQWRYSPTLLNGQPIEVDTTITVNFKLS